MYATAVGAASSPSSLRARFSRCGQTSNGDAFPDDQAATGKGGKGETGGMGEVSQARSEAVKVGGAGRFTAGRFADLGSLVLAVLRKLGVFALFSA